MKDVTEQVSQGLINQSLRGRPPTRDWDSWLRPGRTIEIVQGEDFDCLAESLRPQAYNAARSRGLKVKVKIGENEAGAACVWLTTTSDLESPTWQQQQQTVTQAAAAEGITFFPEPITTEEYASRYGEANMGLAGALRPTTPTPSTPSSIDLDEDTDLFPEGIGRRGDS